MKRTEEPEHFAQFFGNVNKRGSIIVQNTKLSLFKNSFRLRGSSNRNELPFEIRKLDRLITFKKQLRQWIKENVQQFYD